MTAETARVNPTYETLSFDPTLLRSLAEHEGLSFSLYLRGHQGGAHTQTAAQRIRSFSQRADEILCAQNIIAPDRRALLDPVLALADEKEFSLGQHGGYAILRSVTRLIVIPLSTVDQDRLALEGRFLLTPMLWMLAPASAYDVLCISRKRARLLAMTTADHAEVELPATVPLDVAAFQSTDQPDHQLANRSSAGPSLGSMKGVMFGTGVEREKEDRHYRDFCKALARTLAPILRQRQRPLLLAGATAELAIYAQVNDYALTVGPRLTLSPDGGLGDAEIKRRADQILATWIDPATAHALAQFEAAGAARALLETHSIVRAAHAGQVECLLWSEGEPQFGNLEHLVNTRHYAGEHASTHDDLGNAAVIETLRHGGQVHPVPREAMPEKSALAAVLRY